MYQKKINFVKWLVKLLFDDDIEFTLCRKGWLKELAWTANANPNSKVLVISILRLDGTDFETAHNIYKEMNNTISKESK